MIKYKSKTGIGIIFLLVIILGGLSAIMIVNRIWPGLAIIMTVAAFACYLFITTYYVINGNDLIIKSAFIVNTSIKIESITKVEETNNSLSAPATSLDRLAIYYSKSGFVMISPKNKTEFINKLTELNPCIEVKLKTNA